MRSKTTLLLMTAFLFTTGVTLYAAEAVIGEKAPGFSLTDTSGNERTLSDFDDKYVVLEWLNHDCPFVRKHYDSGNMQKLQKTYVEKDVVWLSICSSAPGKQGYYEPEAANQLTEDKGAAPTAVLLDPDGTVGKQFGAKVTPHMFVIDPEGVLIYQGAIDDIPSPRSSDVAVAHNYVAGVLDAAMSGVAIERTSTKPYGCGVKYKK